MNVIRKYNNLKFMGYIVNIQKENYPNPTHKLFICDTNVLYGILAYQRKVM